MTRLSFSSMVRRFESGQKSSEVQNGQPSQTVKPMKNLRLGMFAALLTLWLATTSTFAIEGLKLKIRCPDVVLSWPSTNGETYIVQYRPTLDTNSSWITLTNFMPPASGTNLTLFVHSNRVSCPVGQVFGMMRMAGGVNEESSAIKSVAAIVSKAERAAILEAREEARLTSLFEKCKVAGREPYDWEIKNQPPLPPSPEEVRAKILKAKANKTDMASAANLKSAALVTEEVALESFGAVNNSGDPQSASGPSGLNGIEPSCGFYRVVRNGIHLFGVTNGMVVSGVMNIPIEYSLSSTDELVGFSFYSGANPLTGIDFENDDMLRVLKWNTQTLTNGTYSIGAEASFVLDASVTNQPVTVVVSNLVSFPNHFSAIFGDYWMWLNAKVRVPVATVEIKMHDANDNYIGSFFKSTTNGTISFIWDLTDGNGFTFADASFRGEFYVSAPAGSGGGGGAAMSDVPGGSQTWCKEANWGNADRFVVAFTAADDSSSKTYKIGQMVIGGDGSYGGVVSTLSFNGGGGYQLSPGNVYGSSAFQLYDANSRSQLLGYLADPNYRNFYFFGHGNKRGIAGVTTNTIITDQDIVRTLHNYINSEKPTNGHPYRFVFIDGCDTGKGNFCEGFGIPAIVRDRQFFLNTSVRSRAFLGFKGDVPFNQNQWIARSLQLNYFFADWQSFFPLNICISNAVNGTHQLLETLPSSWIIYGATNLQKDLY